MTPQRTLETEALRGSDVEAVRVGLQRARWRLRTAAYGGPEWDAATAAVAELEAQLDWPADPGDLVSPEGFEPSTK